MPVRSCARGNAEDQPWVALGRLGTKLFGGSPVFPISSFRLSLKVQDQEALEQMMVARELSAFAPVISMLEIEHPGISMGSSKWQRIGLLPMRT